VRRIVLARPAVEAGESLGFLPGDMQAKVDPYLRPLYDALDEMMPPERVVKALETRTIEIAPLAFMRGRTLGDAFVILDEAQNATNAQMKMFLTRLGVNSKIVITGDKTQIDLPNREESGLKQVERILTASRGSSSTTSPTPTSCAIAWCATSSRRTRTTTADPAVTMWATDGEEPPGGRAAALRFHGVRLLIGLALASRRTCCSRRRPRSSCPLHEVGAVAPDNVIAPFAFRVPKTPAELASERDALTRTVPPAFAYSAAALDSPAGSSPRCRGGRQRVRGGAGRGRE
jgi:hypothetical protein